jgi:hypothetical protein
MSAGKRKSATFWRISMVPLWPKSAGRSAGTAPSIGKVCFQCPLAVRRRGVVPTGRAADRMDAIVVAVTGTPGLGKARRDMARRGRSSPGLLKTRHQHEQEMRS